MRIAISPDENPGDPGTQADPTITERQLNIEVATALQAALERCGEDAWFDPSMTFVDRVAKANSDGTQLLFACAHNVGGGQGMVALFCTGGHQAQTPRWMDGTPNKQDDLAAAIGDELEKVGLTDSWHPLDEDVYECCNFRADTAYIEFLFMDSAHDQQLYHQPDYPTKAAEAACRAIARTYGFLYVPAPEPAPAPAPAADPAPAPAPATSAAVPILVSTYLNQRHVFREAGGQLEHHWQPIGTATWSSELVPSSTGLQPGTFVAGEQSGGQQHLYAERADGKLLHAWQAIGAAGWSTEALP